MTVQVPLKLTTGDRLADGSIIVRDEDRLCYQVLSTAKGVTGLRTINKALLEEWVGAVRQHPNYSSSELRDLLSGRTEIDKFEYGYAATLKKMADMVLGNVGVVRPRPDYSADFCRWFAENRGKGKDTTAKKYISYFKTLTDTYQEPTNSYWHGLYRVMYSVDAEKDVIEIGGSAEFERIYGSIVTALEEKVKGVGMTDEGFQRAIDWFWKPEVKSHTCVTSALNAYSDFLKWRETQQPQETKPEELPPNVDRLSIALKLFEEKRGTAKHDRSYDENTARIRTQGQIIDGDYLVGSDYVSFRKTLHDRQIANSYFAKHTDEDKWKLGEFMAAVRNDPKDISYYLSKENRPKVSGVGDMLLTAFLTRVRPDLYACYSNPLFVSVKLFGMTNDDALPQMTLGSYNTYKGIQTIIRDRMREMGIKAENGNDADYLTVNEFTWFVYDNLDLVKEAMPPEFRVPENVDRLSIALKLFAKKRKEDGEDGWLETGRAVNGRIREYFDPLTEEAIGAFGEEQVEELFCGKKSADGKVEFVTMWSGKNGQGWSHIKKGLDDGKLSEIVGYLVSLKHGLEIASQFCRADFDWHYGFGRSVISELLMKFHPENCIKHGERSHNALAWLRLIDFSWVRKYSSEEYSQVCGAAAKILAKMKAMDMSRQINADGTEDASPPDYLTVNEFLYFVDTNLEKIKEKVMSKEFKNVSKKAKTGERKLSKAVENDEMMQRLMAALRTKPFAILAGHSGTGKSQLVRRLACMTCNDEGLLAERNDYNAPGNYCMVQVKPNWHDSTDLLGYYTEMNGGKYHTTSFVEFICKAYAYPETPFFVCLDEMNLAPVEQYFAEFLSAIESYSETTKCTDRLITEKASPEEICGETKLTESLEEVKKHGLTIPRNLFVVGTVNVDETTCQFSRKVLDRAMTILMTAVSFKSMTEPNDPSKEECLDPAGIRFFLERPTQTALVQGQMDRLDEVQKQIGDTPFAIAYRFANEYALYQAAYQILMDKGVGSDGKPDLNDAESQKTALDHVVLMKLLPRIHGEAKTVKGIFAGRKADGKDVPGLKSKLPSDGLSVAMMDKILARDDEYLTFWP